MANPATQPLTDDDRSLMQRFDTSFAVAKSVVNSDSGPLTAIIRGAQAAYAAIINRWQSHRGPTNRIHFDNVGHWGENYLDRAALTEYIQVGNDRKAAFYANAFVDASGLPLDGGSFAYTIQFAQNELPEYKRFWSMTAYTPEYIELVPNAADKYVVASYTPGLVTASDGSVTIYVQSDQPKKSTANWMPIPKDTSAFCSASMGRWAARSRGRMCRPRFTGRSRTRSTRRPRQNGNIHPPLFQPAEPDTYAA